MTSNKTVLLSLLFSVYCFAFPFTLHADEVIMKDGTVYKGKILVDSDKAILIGNPPFDPNSYFLKTEDIAKIIYEQYHPNAPAERKRGLVLETRLDGQVVSSSLLPFSPAPGIYAGAGFRVHPAFEIDGGVEWNPALSASNGFAVSNSTIPATAQTRQYQDFFMYTGMVNGRFYPFYEKKWTTEPYLLAGYSWSNLIPKASGDNLTGSGWQLGFGLIRPLTTHLFLEARFAYQSSGFDTINFLGHQGSLQPEIEEHIFTFGTGISYRL